MLIFFTTTGVVFSIYSNVWTKYNQDDSLYPENNHIQEIQIFTSIELVQLYR